LGKVAAAVRVEHRELPLAKRRAVEGHRRVKVMIESVALEVLIILTQLVEGDLAVAVGVEGAEVEGDMDSFTAAAGEGQQRRRNVDGLGLAEEAIPIAIE